MKTGLACLILLTLLLSACKAKDGIRACPSSSTNTHHASTIQIVTESYPPYSMEENGVITGISSDVVRAIFRIAQPSPKSG